MFSVSFSDQLRMSWVKSSGEVASTFEPFRPYIVSSVQISRIGTNPETQARVHKTTKLGAHIPNFNVRAQKPGRVFFYTGGGGFGDQIMAWPVAQHLHRLGYEIDVYAEPGNEYCWWCMPWIRQVSVLPCLKSIFDNYKHFCVFEEVTNMDESSDQAHPVDVMLKKIGVDPMTIPVEDKVVKPEFTPTEKNRARTLLRGLQIPFEKFALVQLSASTKLRSFTAEEAIVYLKSMATAYPQIAWLHMSDKFNDPALKYLVQGSGVPNLFALSFPDMRDSWAAISVCEVFVGVDSMGIHVAGSLGKAAVGIWGPVDPMVRMKYYRNHVPLFEKQACKYAPCFFASGPNLPPFCPPQTPPAKSCQVMQAATPDMVIAALRYLNVDKK